MYSQTDLAGSLLGSRAHELIRDRGYAVPACQPRQQMDEVNSTLRYANIFLLIDILIDEPYHKPYGRLHHGPSTNMHHHLISYRIASFLPGSPILTCHSLITRQMIALFVKDRMMLNHMVDWELRSLKLS